MTVILATAADGVSRLATHLGYVAGIITVGAFLPQVVRAWRTRRTRDLSLGTFALLVTAGTMWAVYGVLRRDWPVVATNMGMVLLNLALAVAKLRFDARGDAPPASPHAPGMD